MPRRGPGLPGLGAAYIESVSVQTIPILPSSDLDATASFYEGLGFAVVGRWPDEYLIIGHVNGIELHFWFNPTEDPKTNDVACYIRFATRGESLALFEACRAVGLPPAESREAPRLHSWEDDPDEDEWVLIDVHGNLLRFDVPVD